jgi:drug/metabolite transporter (DMT)-like permease
MSDRPVPSAPRWALVATALAVVYVVWGSTYLGIRIVVEEADPLTAMGQRYTVAGILLAIVLAVRSGPQRLALTGRQLLGCAVLGLLLPLLGNGMVSVAEAHGATSGYTALLIAVTPLAIVVFRTVEHDRPRPMTLVGVLAGFAGLAILVLLGRGDADPVPLGPALLVLFAGTCWALGSYIQPRLWLPRDPFVIAVYEMFLGGLMMTVTGIAVGEQFTFDYSTRTWLALGYLVVFGSVLAFTAYVWLVSNAPISLVATYAYVNPVIAVLLGWLVLDETLSLATVVGGSIVVGAVAVVITSERR